MNNKRIKDSITEQVHILSQGNLNGYRRLFGGKLMSWMDVVAAVVARRHSERNVTTAVVDMLEFKAPAYANDTICIIGKITYVGNTSMEVKVDVYVEELTHERRLINTAYFVMVALDENEKPTKVPGIILETEEEIQEYEKAKLRKERRKSYNA
jgi:acyl-CoA hydrolase